MRNSEDYGYGSDRKRLRSRTAQVLNQQKPSRQQIPSEDYFFKSRPKGDCQYHLVPAALNSKWLMRKVRHGQDATTRKKTHCHAARGATSANSVPCDEFEPEALQFAR
jgi:hypothetical protein